MNILLLIAAAVQQVEIYSKPLVRYNGTEAILDLDETSVELRQGLIGMKEGEVRIIYIHSEPVEVELVKADATFETHAASAREDGIPRNFF